MFLILFQLFLLFAGGYQLFLTFFGWFKYKPGPVFKPQKSFALLIAAHNEEKVLGALIDNLQKLKYPRELYDIFVICDNCDDHTAEIARHHGAFAFERLNSKLRGKGYAIEWMLEKLWNFDRQYDAVIMFDADNLVSLDFLTHMNNDLCSGAKVIQGYLDTKNPSDSWITASFAISYYFSNRFLQIARRNLKLPNYLGGTGMCFDTELLKKIGWGSTSLVEDLEFSMRCIKQGVFPIFNYYAKLYDEKPITFMASVKQRLRWMQGHFEVARKYFFVLLWQGITQLSWKKIDAAIHAVGVYNYLLSSILIISFWFINFSQLATDIKLLQSYFQVIFNILTVAIFALMIISTFLEKAKTKTYRFILFFPIFIASWLPITCYAFFTQQNKQWTHTKHTRVIQMEELQSGNS